MVVLGIFGIVTLTTRRLLDSSPEVSHRVGSMLGIGDDYYTTIPPDLKSDDELRRCLARIHRIIAVVFETLSDILKLNFDRLVIVFTTSIQLRS